MVTEDSAKRIVESIGYALAGGFIALIVMNFMGYDIVHEDDYYTPEYVGELIQENENRKYECNVLVTERDYAVASAYFLNALLEKRNGDEYLYGVYTPGEIYTDSDGFFMDTNYYYIDFLDEFCSAYADESISYKLSDDYDHDFASFRTDYHFGDFLEMLNTVEESGQQHRNLEKLK